MTSDSLPAHCYRIPGRVYRVTTCGVFFLDTSLYSTSYSLLHTLPPESVLMQQRLSLINLTTRITETDKIRGPTVVHGSRFWMPHFYPQREADGVGC